MSKSLHVFTVMALSVALLNGQSFLAELKAIPNAAKRSEKALAFADAAFESAHSFYAKGEIDNGDAQLEDMISALNECVGSLAAARKPQLYKKAELKVALLQRCMQALVSDVEFQRRGWAAYSERKLDQIHNRLLDGAMAK